MSLTSDTFLANDPGLKYVAAAFELLCQVGNFLVEEFVISARSDAIQLFPLSTGLMLYSLGAVNYVADNHEPEYSCPPAYYGKSITLLHVARYQKYQNTNTCGFIYVCHGLHMEKALMECKDFTFNANVKSAATLAC